MIIHKSYTSIGYSNSCRITFCFPEPERFKIWIDCPAEKGHVPINIPQAVGCICQGDCICCWPCHINSLLYKSNSFFKIFIVLCKISKGIIWIYYPSVIACFFKELKPQGSISFCFLNIAFYTEDIWQVVTCPGFSKCIIQFLVKFISLHWIVFRAVGIVEWFCKPCRTQYKECISSASGIINIFRFLKWLMGEGDYHIRIFPWTQQQVIVSFIN